MHVVRRKSHAWVNNLCYSQTQHTLGGAKPSGRELDVAINLKKKFKPNKQVLVRFFFKKNNSWPQRTVKVNYKRCATSRDRPHFRTVKDKFHHTTQQTRNLNQTPQQTLIHLSINGYFGCFFFVYLYNFVVKFMANNNCFNAARHYGQTTNEDNLVYSRSSVQCLNCMFLI